MRNEQERLAREWAERIKSVPEVNYGPEANAAAEHILATTAPLSMADVEWDDEKHYLAGAVDADGHEVVMLGTVMGDIRVCDVDEVNKKFAPVLENTGTLTPNGKRYELQDMTDVPEDPEPEHPETLETVEDYENAPKGTIVAAKDYFPYAKLRRGYWEHPRQIPRTDASMADTPRKVIRWGWGE